MARCRRRRRRCPPERGCGRPCRYKSLRPHGSWPGWCPAEGRTDGALRLGGAIAAGTPAGQRRCRLSADQQRRRCPEHLIAVNAAGHSSSPLTGGRQSPLRRATIVSAGRTGRRMRYLAFISYVHRNAWRQHRLHRAMETYRVHAGSAASAGCPSVPAGCSSIGGAAQLVGPVRRDPEGAGRRGEPASGLLAGRCRLALGQRGSAPFP